MRILKQTGQFKKDLKRIQNDHRKIASLRTVLESLQATGGVPQEYRSHQLAGNYKGYMECHVENDLLLIWFDESKELIKLVRLGSHSEIF